MHGCRLLITTVLLKKVLTQLLLAHQGVNRPKQRAWLTLSWPGMDYNIEHMVTSAHTVRTTYPLTTRNYCKQSLGQHNPSRRKLLIFATMQGEATYFLYYGMPSHSIPSIRDGLLPVQKLYGHPIQGTILIQEQAFSPEGSTVEKRQSDTLSNHRRQLQQDTISQPAASLPDITMGKVWLCRIQGQGHGTHMD